MKTAKIVKDVNELIGLVKIEDLEVGQHLIWRCTVESIELNSGIKRDGTAINVCSLIISDGTKINSFDTFDITLFELFRLIPIKSVITLVHKGFKDARVWYKIEEGSDDAVPIASNGSIQVVSDIYIELPLKEGK